MTRFLCLAIALSSLAAAPGCSSCFGGGSGCRRPSFMEFRSPCGRRSEPCPPPMAAPCGPVCEPCGPMSSPAPCCGEGGFSTLPGEISAPMAAPAAEPGTFS
jgi:hypothetical protein